MTMPHMMNCQHIEDGWCLDCVAELAKDSERIDFLATCNQTWPIADELKDESGNPVTDIYDWIAEVDSSEDPPDGNCLRKAFRMMVDAGIKARDAATFGAHLSAAEKIVAGWPEWKKRVLGMADERK